MKQLRQISEETWISLLLVIAVFSTELAIMVVIELIAPQFLSMSSLLRIILDATILVLVIAPIVLIPKRRVTEAKNRLRRILDEAGDGLLVIDRKYNIITANPLAEKFLKIQPEKFAGKKCFEVIKSNLCRTNSCCMNRILSGESLIVSEKQIGDRWIQDITTPYRDSSGNIQGLIKSIRDITAQKNSEENIRRLNSILKAIRGINSLITKESNTDKMLAKSCEILREVRGYFHIAIAGYDNGIKKIAESGFGGFFGIDEDTPLCIERVLQTRNPVIFDDTKKHCGKCPYHLEEHDYSVAIIPFNALNRIHFLVVFAEIAHFDGEEIQLLKEVSNDIGFAIDKYKAESDLKKTEREKAAILDSMTEIVTYRDRTMRVLWANRAACEALGLSPDEPIGRYCYELWHQRSEPCENCLLEEVFRTGQPQDAEITTPDGRVWSVRGYPVMDDNGNVIGGVEASLDITEKKEMDERLKTIHALGQRLVLSRDIDEITCTVVNAVHRVLQIPVCGLWLLDEKREVLVRKAYTGLVNEVPAIPLNSEKGITRAVAVSGEAIYLPDVRKDSRYIGSDFPSISELCIPLRAGDRVIGVLNVESDKVDAFNESDMQLLTTLADQAAMAIQNARLFMEIESSEKRYRAILENSVDAIISIDPELKIAAWSVGAERIFGYSKEEVTGKSLEILFPEDGGESAIKLLKKVRKKGFLRNLETKRRARDGRMVDVDMTITYLGHELGYTAILRDVTERKKAEQALIESEIRYRTTFEHTGTAMAILEEDTTISLVNEEFERLSGYKKEEIEGKMSWTQFIHPDDLDRLMRYHHANIEGKEVPKKLEFRAVDKGGRIKNIFLVAEEIPGTKKIVTSFIDITRLKKVNKLLKVSTEINELVAREKNPEILLKTVSRKLVTLYDSAFTVLKEDGNLIPIELEGIDSECMERVIEQCPSISKALKEGMVDLKEGGEICNECLSEPLRYVLTIPLRHDKLHGAIIIHSNSDFNEDEIELLQKLSSNIAFALTAYEVEEDRKRAFDQLATNLMQFDHSADRLRNPLAAIMGSIELKDEIGVDRVIDIVKEHAKRIKKELDEMRKEEIRTYKLTEKFKQRT